MTPLMQWVDTEKSEVSKAELKQIFSNIEMILSIHNEILSTLEERLAAWDASQFIGDIFMRIVSPLPPILDSFQFTTSHNHPHLLVLSL
jgi:hypothetical protein